MSLPTECISVIFGSSGVGKSTLLRLLAGLEQPDQGKISFCDQLWLDTKAKFCLPTQQRPLGFVFQDGALFPHLNVADNLRFGNKEPQIFTQVVEFMELGGLLKRSIHTLSGGQKQRVALARALARALGTKNALLCLDEPLSALDAPSRNALQEELKRLSRHFKLTTLIITHDLQEAIFLADYLVHIHTQEGRHFCTSGDLKTLLNAPMSPSLLGRVLCVQDGMLTLALAQQHLQVVYPPTSTLQAGDWVWVCFEASCWTLRKAAS
ncbi:ATP-binding cassette domain-containing protein [Helicobacter cynogastricus]|uniref:ATP-binding cassette domain-containing protein n=1 Tax=Helicobacter cynogastricus TaxID=329937 RepID=UPI001F291964|nr:ATP-binding cassette domain-containing protein [Helicobacter cynogastricus]